MNIRILAASALALAILVPAANAASEHGGRSSHHFSSGASGGSDSDCAIGTTLDLRTAECVAFPSHRIVYPRHKVAVKYKTSSKLDFSDVGITGRS